MVNTDSYEPVMQFAAWLAVELAPTICGNKPSTILSFIDTRCQALLTTWRQAGSELLGDTMISHIILRQSFTSETVLFYRPDMLAQCLTDKRHRYFLQRMGYPVDEGTEACLELLKLRFQQCCPHEIGILLGIPLKDVLGFMGMTRLPLTCRGEWCIYGKQDESLATMQQFADDKSAVACLLAQGTTAYEIMCGRLQPLPQVV